MWQNNSTVMACDSTVTAINSTAIGCNSTDKGVSPNSLNTHILMSKWDTVSSRAQPFSDSDLHSHPCLNSNKGFNLFSSIRLDKNCHICSRFASAQPLGGSWQTGAGF